MNYSFTRAQECGIRREIVSLWAGHQADSSITPPFIPTSKNALNYSFKKSKNIATNTNKTVLEYLTFGDYLYACLYDSILKDFTLYKQYTNQRFFPKENPRNSPSWTKALKGCLHTVTAPP